MNFPPQGLIAQAAAPGSITPAMLASQADQTVLANNSGAAASPTATGIIGVLDIQINKTAPAITAGALALNLALGDVFAVSNNANITSITVSGVATTGRMSSFQLMLTGNGTGYTQVWMSGIVWPGGAAPTLTTTLNKRDWLQFQTFDGGTTWFGFVLGQNF